ADDEEVARAGDQEPGEGGVLVDHIDGPPDAEVHGGRQGVALVGAVDDAVGEGAVALEAEVGRPQPVAFRRTGLTHLSAAATCERRLRGSRETPRRTWVRSRPPRRRPRWDPSPGRRIRVR